MPNEKRKLGVHTFAEIMTQADSWEGVTRRIDEQAGKYKDLYTGSEEILFTGCGSAFNISYAVAPFFQKLSGKTCRPVHASDLMINPGLFLNGNRPTLVVGFSRSGETTESLAALETARKAGAATIAVVCFAQSRMANIADATLVLEEAVEKSVATTRSLTAMILAGYYLAGVCTENSEVCNCLKTLPNISRRKMDDFHELGRQIGTEEQLTKFAFLGSGSYYGLAREAQLKVKEMVLQPSDSYVSLDYQHGPMSNVDENMLVTIMVSDAGQVYDLELAKNMKGLGGKLLVLCDKDTQGFAGVADYVMELSTGLGDGLRDILYMPVIQFMAYYKSLAGGYDPDNPENLFYYVGLKTERRADQNAENAGASSDVSVRKE